MKREMSPLIARLAFLRMPGASCRRLHQLVSCFGGLEQVWSHPDTAYHAMQLPVAGKDWLIRPDWSLVENDLRWLEQPGRMLLWCDDPAYPALLGEIASPPAGLFVQGSIDALSLPQLAVVGTRQPSSQAVMTTRRFAAEMVYNGLAVTSGFAQGIDAAAHQGALDADGVTLAVFGCGLDRVYPSGHIALASGIVEGGGALISEFSPGVLPLRQNFPQRNRIISGLSLGTLVIEAALKSGSLITAAMALDQGREVFAMPGSIHDPRAKGCNSLIKQGAKLVESVEDIFSEIGALHDWVRTRLPAGKPQLSDPVKSELLSHIAYTATTVDTLALTTGLSASSLATHLAMLELAGYVICLPEGGYIRVDDAVCQGARLDERKCH